jgi:hypothetical protein
VFVIPSSLVARLFSLGLNQYPFFNRNKVVDFWLERIFFFVLNSAVAIPLLLNAESFISRCEKLAVNSPTSIALNPELVFFIPRQEYCVVW